MGKAIVQKIIDVHYVSGDKKDGKEVAVRIDQTLTQDATGTMAYLQFEAMGHRGLRPRRRSGGGAGQFPRSPAGMPCAGRT